MYNLEYLYIIRALNPLKILQKISFFFFITNLINIISKSYVKIKHFVTQIELNVHCILQIYSINFKLNVYVINGN